MIVHILNEGNVLQWDFVFLQRRRPGSREGVEMASGRWSAARRLAGDNPKFNHSAHMEKAYDRIPRNVMWWALEKHKVPLKYITLIKDMYDNVVTSVRTSDGDTDDFPIMPLVLCFSQMMALLL